MFSMSLIKKKIRDHLKKDPVIAPLIARYKIENRHSKNPLYLDLMYSIMSQQLSVASAAAIRNKFEAQFNTKKISPKSIKNCTIEMLRSCGLSNQKAQYLKNIAEFFTQKENAKEDWEGISNEEIIKRLTSIKGVGVWTSQMVLMFNLIRSDVFPTDDYGIQMAIKDLYQLKEEKKALKNKMLEISLPWSPFRSYACLYLWEHRNNQLKKAN